MYPLFQAGWHTEVKDINVLQMRCSDQKKKKKDGPHLLRQKAATLTCELENNNNAKTKDRRVGAVARDVRKNVRVLSRSRSQMCHRVDLHLVFAVLPV